VGIIDVERQGGGLDGGSTLNQQEMRSKSNSILLAFKTAINLRFFRRNECTTRFRWNYAKHSTQ
jgi:hypothetical protein